MARRRLTRDNLAISTQCYVCDPTNEAGLHIAYFLDDKTGRVTAEYTPQDFHQGAPGIVHGGVLAAILDDAMAWAVNVLSGSFGLTRRTEIEYSRMVRTGESYSVTAWISEIEKSVAVAIGELRRSDGKVCCGTKAEFSLISQEEAQQAFERGNRGKGN